ncbi:MULTISPECIES: ABC transporter transmembrane domain-containing protein [unclassified Devosia]|uniref:ABC transporter ATP-binding protein n=1 Tax=unclassified Devosia TaxID=196773 RepID=UPI0020C17E3A|nr:MULTISPECIES: ABC transporter transmembrane domain-containing protein [unclassified Devosia]
MTLTFLVLSTSASLFIPLFFGRMIDTGFVARDLGTVGHHAWIIGLFGAAAALANGIRFYHIAYIGERIVADIRLSVFAHLLSLDPAFFDRHRVGDLASRLNGDVSTIKAAITATASTALRALVTMAGAFLFMLTTNVFLTVAVVLAAPLIMLPLLLMARRLRSMSRRSQDALADLAARSTEVLSATRTVKSFTRERQEVGRYQAIGEGSFRSEIGRLKSRALMMSLLMLLSSTAMIFVIWWGAQAVFHGLASTGELTQFLLYAWMGAGALATLSEVAGSLHVVAGSTERVVEILSTPATIATPAAPEALPAEGTGVIAFRNVTFRFQRDDPEPVLDRLSFEAKSGQTIALVGSSGAGKSTIFSLLQRFYDVEIGAILVDGVDVRHADLHQLRRRIAVVEQEPTIFSGTVEDNIRFGDTQASRDAVVAACEMALAHEFIAAMPLGYDTPVGERGVTLSGGQRQRLAIARAVLKNAPILLLDEATSALDSNSERLVQTAISRLRSGRTTLVIAHRLATIRTADTILVISRGRIVDQGSHDELMGRDGPYADLARLQFSLAVA